MSHQWVDRTARSEPVRLVKLIKIDGNVHSFRDDGCNREGKPNQQRALLLAAMAKRIPIPNFDPKVLDEVLAGKRSYEDLTINGPVRNADGEPVFAHVFRLAEPPPRFPYEKIPEKSREAIRANDMLDRTAPFRSGDDGAWALPSETWKAYSRAWCAMKKKTRAGTESLLAEATRSQAGEAMVKVLRMVTGNGKRTGGTHVSP